MKHKKTVILWSLLTVTLVTLYGVGLFNQQSNDAINYPLPITTADVCTEGHVKTDPLGNVFTCVGDKYEYTGNLNDYKG